MLLQAPKKGKAKYNPLWEGHHINSKEKLYILCQACLSS